MRRLVVALAVAGMLVAVPGALGRPILGVTGNVARFKEQTRQASLVDEAFLGWGQGETYGAPFNVLLGSLAPVPMLHLGTAGLGGKKQAITISDIAAGRGDGYLAALNHALSQWGRAAYVRPLGEMNNPGNPWSQPVAAYRKAFARIDVLVHGGPTVGASLRALGLPPFTGGPLDANPFPRVRVLWSPLATNNDFKPYWPGDAYVDVGGADIYDEGSAPPWRQFTAIDAFVRAHHKPFSVPEWGLFGIDDPKFILDMCTFLKTHPTETEEFFESKPGTIFDLGNKPRSRAAYASCITPLGAPLPRWAVGGAGTAKLVSLSLGGDVPAGGSVTFPVTAKLTVPIVHWEVAFGDGEEQSGSGSPPASIAHDYPAGHSYEAVLVVYASPPFDPGAIRFYATTAVGSGPPAVLFTASPSGRKVSFRIQQDVGAGASSWQLLFGDGLANAKPGTPPHFAGHTYAKAGTYHALLVEDLPQHGRLISTVTVVARG